MRLRNFLNIIGQYLLHPILTYEGRKKLLLERKVDKAVRDMEINGWPPGTLRRIALARRYQGAEGNPAVRYLAASEVGRLAAAKKLAMDDQWDRILAEEFAWTGYQKLLQGDLVLKNLSVVYSGGPLVAEYFYSSPIFKFLQEASTNELRQISPEFLKKLLPKHSEFAKENEEFVCYTRRKLVDRPDLGRIRNQMSDEWKELVDEVVEIVNKEDLVAEQA